MLLLAAHNRLDPVAVVQMQRFVANRNITVGRPVALPFITRSPVVDDIHRQWTLVTALEPFRRSLGHANGNSRVKVDSLEDAVAGHGDIYLEGLGGGR
jgi:hypothetical protein